MYCDSLKKKNLLDFCENLLENLLKSPKKSKSKSAMTPDLLHILSRYTHIYLMKHKLVSTICKSNLE